MDATCNPTSLRRLPVPPDNTGKEHGAAMDQPDCARARARPGFAENTANLQQTSATTGRLAGPSPPPSAHPSRAYRPFRPAEQIGNLGLVFNGQTDAT